ncbi:hypothetical protein QBC34DRAFT_497021 [Podospora aff. communis PSN243]|uniref:Protein kinase domain-containing protein n=1 Tax=Podospora aff. communis PSN243 TaxID=3040156 RepID=A0AAV9GH22_9PEZI|nr:hypothetical protein QBC34DRAFT_497021 [Podospora aff. communis PSN243]
MHTSGQTPADRRTRNLRPSDLPPVMLADDPRLHLEPISLEDCAAENEPEGFIPLSDALLIKRSCSKNEADMLEYAGKEIAIRLVTRIGTVDTISSTFHQQSAIIERGVPCVLSEIRPEERLPTSLRIIELVSQLHARGIIHGDINPSALRWNPQGQLVFADFANARFVQDSDREQNQEQRRWDGDEEFVSPRARSNTRFGQPFVPTESDDLFAIANSGPSPDLSVITDPDVLGDLSAKSRTDIGTGS